MMDFEQDPRRKQELRCRPFADKIYRSVFGDEIEILRDSDIILDRYFAIDVRIKLHNGMNLLGQEKFLSEKYASFNTVTVEYYQNQHTKELGDWFRMGVQIYLCGYEFSEGLKPFVLLDWTKVAIYSNQNKITWRHQVNKDGHAKASFCTVNIDLIPSSCVIAKQ